MGLGTAARSIFVEIGLADGATGQMAAINKEADKTKTALVEVTEAARKAQNAQRNTFLGLGAAMGVSGAFGLSYFQEGTKDLAKYQDAYAAFKTNVKGNADDLTASLKNASAGLMDEGDMLAQANKALIMGVPQDKLAQLMVTSRALARQTGEDLPTVWESLTSGAARASPRTLMAIGIQMNDLTEAEKSWAHARGISTSALTDAQKSQIFMNYVLEHSNEIVKKTDLSQESLNETLVRSNRSWIELQQELSEGALPVMVSVLKITNGMVDGLRALPAPVKGVIGVVGVLGAGLFILGSVTLLNAAAFLMLKNEMLAATETSTLWEASQAMLIGESGILTGALGLLSTAWDVVATSEVAALWPLAPLLAAGYLLYDLYSKGWQDSMLGRFFAWLGDTVPGLQDSFTGLVYVVKSLWEWILKIPDAVKTAWSNIQDHPLWPVAEAAFSVTPMGAAIHAARIAKTAAPVVIPAAERLMASSSSIRTVQTGDIKYDVKFGDIHTSKLDDGQIADLLHRAIKQASKQTQQDISRELLAVNI
jgi:hypothetical protein